MTTRAIWIVGTPFSGSTMAQWLVGRFSKVFVAGEVDRVRVFRMHPHLENDPKCYLDYCARCRAHDEDCAVWTPELFGDLAMLGPGPGVYDALARASGAEVVVDASKTPWWFLNVTNHADFRSWSGRVFVLHCVRTPFAFAVSYSNRTGLPLEQCVLSWVIINRDALGVVQRCGAFAPVLTVYHNRLLRDPEGFLQTMSNWLDIGEDLGGERDHHFLGGNVAAYPFKVKEEQTTEAFDASIDHFSKVDAVSDDDGRWRGRIDAGMRWRLAGLPGVRETCAVFGINIDALIGS
ncbi:hypothetical protein [Hyphomicrobium sp. DY-1]|uniref:hypothetical protein n=1 Tax=Hyphomicrobium sp. DY-1 TaxID=3075650 RepID=UPI0039C3062A